MNLKQARKKGKLDKFIAEHEADAPADRKRFQKALEQVSQREPKQTPEPDEGTSN